MSRIGKKPIAVPGGVKVAVNSQDVAIEGPLGKLEWTAPRHIAVEHNQDDGAIRVTRASEESFVRALHGMSRALIQNMVLGVTQGFEKRLEIVGVGYIAAVQNNQLQLRVGFANEIHLPIPAGVDVTCPDQMHVVVKGCDKQKVGQFAAEVRAVRKPEPYKGKGIHYEGEQVRRKAGKTVVK